MPSSPPSRRLPARVVTALLALAAALAPAAAAAAAAPSPSGDPGLGQTIAPDEPVVRGEHVITAGHVDMGPKIDGGSWKFLIHDDAARANPGARSVWRYPDQTVLHVVDAAKLTVPQGDTYAFLGAEPGSPVWVVPQTQNPEVVWAGWNTQDPTVMQRIDRGATFSVDAVQGPGFLTVYLQSGDFGAPQVLWDSRKAGAQPAFVDTNTHTHANWVFTEPGVYLVRMTVAATLVDGSKVSDTQLVRFAVGTATAPADALAAGWQGPTPTPASTTSAPPAPVAAEDGGGSGAVVFLGIGALAVTLVAGVILAVVRSDRARRRVLAGRTSARTDGSTAGQTPAVPPATGDDRVPRDGSGP